jgi:hypothetical protein
MSEEEAVAATLSTVRQRAMEIVELPLDKREARYRICRQVYIEAAMERGLTRQKAQDWADQMNEWTRALVRKIELSGAGAGGRA